MNHPLSSARRRLLAAAVAGLAISSVNAAERPVQMAQADFASMSIEELMQVPLTLSRTEEPLALTAAAAYVITADDIRRSGATSLPEALRGVPGLEVARADQHSWAVTARGFNDVFANKLLVMIDGRTVYTPLFSGVYWDVQDTVLEDVSRIEVIRGPGATLWGANAVNGVINIVTKRAAETQGGLVTAGGGVGEKAFGALRYGGQITEDLHYRVYGKYFDRDDTDTIPDLPDGSWEMFRGGFRADWLPGTKGQSDAFAPNELTLQGDIYDGDVDQYFWTVASDPVPSVRLERDRPEMSGGNVLGRWTHRFSEEAHVRLQAYYDRTVRESIIFDERRDTGDVDFQNHFKLGRRNSVVWGVGYRFTEDETRGSETILLRPSSRGTDVVSGFVQDEITVVEKRLRATIGTKVEYNDFTGWELQPGARLLWTPATNHSVWAAVTRAVRTPSRAENDVRINNVVPPGAIVPILGNSGFDSEKLVAYELGYRVQPTPVVSLDTALFFNRYDELRTLRIVPTVPAGVVDNDAHGHTYGVELAAKWEPLDWWRIRGSYTFLEMDLDRKRGSNNPDDDNAEGRSPNHQFSLRTGFDLPFRTELDFGVRYVDPIPSFDIRSYFSFDARIGWRPKRNLELSIVGQNLFDPRHEEFRGTTIDTLPVEVGRVIYGKLTWHF
jgi:iron complex outermembrane recepter protein